MKIKTTKLIIFNSRNGELVLHADTLNDNVWATQSQISEIFQIERSVVTKHINNVFKNKELKLSNNVQKMHIENSKKKVNFYSLDLILAVGYKANSSKAIKFRKWASSILKEYMLEGQVINKTLVGENYQKYISAIEQVKSLLPVNSELKAQDVLELLKQFGSTWLSLDSYDKLEFPQKGDTKSLFEFTANELFEDIQKLREDLILKGQASEMFAQEKTPNALKGIVGNIFQTFNKKDLYLSAEEKAAHLLYFIIKNHPFTDGNKRTGAFAFIWYLNKSNLLDKSKISPEALTAITLLIAESNMKDKDRLVGVVLLLLRKNV